MQIIQFPRRPKPAAPPSAVHGQFRSKNVLLEAAWASCVNQTDAIFVLIEAHRNAWHQWAQAVPFEDHPAGEAEVDRRAEIKWRLLDDVFSATPTTIEGLIALADYCRELNELCESELNEDHLLNALEKISRALKAVSHRFD
jgi:hypothetical protein